MWLGVTFPIEGSEVELGGGLGEKRASHEGWCGWEGRMVVVMSECRRGACRVCFRLEGVEGWVGLRKCGRGRLRTDVLSVGGFSQGWGRMMVGGLMEYGKHTLPRYSAQGGVEI